MAVPVDNAAKSTAGAFEKEAKEVCRNLLLDIKIDNRDREHAKEIIAQCRPRSNQFFCCSDGCCNDGKLCFCLSDQ